MFENFNVSESFANQIEFDINNSKLSHAIILEGSDEETRLSCAKEVAMAIFCSSEQKPCKNCRPCKKVINDSHPDLHIIKKDEKATMIKVDEIRELKATALLKPNDSEKAVFIISEARFMNPQARNALLKIFEEPYPNVHFILTTSSKSAFLETIISRGTAYSINPVSDDDTAKYSDEVKTIAENLSDALIKNSESDFLFAVSETKKDRRLLTLVNEYLELIVRDAIVQKSGFEKTVLKDKNISQRLSEKYSIQKLFSFIEHTNEIRKRIKANANMNILVTEFCIGFYK